MVVIIVITVFLVGAYGAYRIHWFLAAVTLGALFFLWYGLHRARVCSFCDQNCPYNPKTMNPRRTQAGFTKLEAAVFYPSFMLILIFYVVAIYLWHVMPGLMASGLLIYALVLYRRRICPNCKLLCPVNPNKAKPYQN
ncbi:hypothetical protein [Desulfoscipio geothermicus]|uniref:Uncharacterized protein n=1 Tax=Desulfoscipio geothermicus DSM 3669 TaxID=1121426 RepID=A0A1I6D7E8_9FIRM|nr:hypothetical protein [Desulfoscipio geothermicus]SFR01385.1 hypothetical protein SAMN05660706_106131 [Desulfoscipio geothermicus DSM 3669]